MGDRAGHNGFWAGAFHSGNGAKPATKMHDVLLTWAAIEPYLRETSAWGQRYSVIARAVDAYRAAWSQRLGVPPNAVCLHYVAPWQVASGQKLTLSADERYDTAVSGVASPAYM